MPNHDFYRVPGAEVADGIPPYLAPRQSPAEDDLSATCVFSTPEWHAPARGRRHRARPAEAGAVRSMGPIVGAAAAFATMAISLLFWISSSGHLRDLVVSHTSREMAQIWPVVIYGPWVVACLSSLLGTFERSGVAQSWVVVVLFSGTATSLGSETFLGVPSEIIIAGLPPIAAAISFHQFMGQISAFRSPGSRRVHARAS